MSARRLFGSAEEALAEVFGARSTIGIGGFGLCGVPETLLRAAERLTSSARHRLTVVSNNGGRPGFGLDAWLANGAIHRLVSSHVGGNPNVSLLHAQGRLGVELIPQGTLVDRLVGASLGWPFVETKVGLGTLFEFGGWPIRRRRHEMDDAGDADCCEIMPPAQISVSSGSPHLVYPPLSLDVALIHAYRADRHGNLQFRRTARNFNPVMARAARVVIAEAEHMTDELDPDEVDLPGVYVDRFVAPVARGSCFEWPDGRVYHRGDIPPHPGDAGVAPCDVPPRHTIIERVIKEIQGHEPSDRGLINLGIGLPTAAATALGPDQILQLHAENGAIGAGGAMPTWSEVDPDTINPSKHPTRLAPGASTFDSLAAFQLIRSGRVKLAVLGAFQVSAGGDLANWVVPGSRIAGPGGAIDLATSPARVVVAMTHRTRDGRPKLVNRCDMPLTAAACVQRIITEVGVFDVEDGGTKLVLKEVLGGGTVDQAVDACEGVHLVVDVGATRVG